MPAKNDIILQTGLFFKKCQNNRRSNFCQSRGRSQAPRCHKEYHQGASLVTQWKIIHLPVQETRVQSLIWEDPTCHGTTMPMHHSYWACALEPGSCNYWAHALQLPKSTAPRAHAPQPEAPGQWEACTPQLESGPRSPQLEKSLCSKEDPAQPQIHKYSHF